MHIDMNDRQILEICWFIGKYGWMILLLSLVLYLAWANYHTQNQQHIEPQKADSLPFEERIKQFFYWPMLSPEEYIAHHSHRIGCFGFDEFQFSDPEFDLWVKRVALILRDLEWRERCRQQCLTAEEYQQVLKEIEEDF
jgi:hypothetical protein